MESSSTESMKTAKTLSCWLKALFISRVSFVSGYVVDLFCLKPACSSVSKFQFLRYQLSWANIILSWILASVEVSAIGL